jgi:hypothetical protein
MINGFGENKQAQRGDMRGKQNTQIASNIQKIK